jgi:hypothetical protein
MVREGGSFVVANVVAWRPIARFGELMKTEASAASRRK